MQWSPLGEAGTSGRFSVTGRVQGAAVSLLGGLRCARAGERDQMVLGSTLPWHASGRAAGRLMLGFRRREVMWRAPGTGEGAAGGSRAEGVLSIQSVAEASLPLPRSSTERSTPPWMTSTDIERQRSTSTLVPLPSIWSSRITLPVSPIQTASMERCTSSFQESRLLFSPTADPAGMAAPLRARRPTA